MLDEEETRLDIAEAIGKATAAICMQHAIIARLKTKGLLSDEEIAEMSGAADEALKSIEGLSEEARTLAKSALRGWAKTWTKRVTRN